MFRQGLLFLFLLCALSSMAQPMKVTRIDPIEVTARVVGLLEGNSNLGVLYITKVDSTNTIRLRPSTEILASFHFGTQPTKGDPKLPGTKSGDMITAEVAGKFDAASGQMEYTVLRYQVLQVTTIKGTSAEADD